MKSGVIHLAAWSCRRLTFTGRVSGDFPGGLLPVLSRSHRKRRQPVFAVPITDVMVNGIFIKGLFPRGYNAGLNG